MDDIFFHPTALVEATQIGAGTRIWAMTHVMPDVQIGTNCSVGDHTFIETGAVIGNNVTIKNGSMIWDGVTIEDGVFVGPQVLFTNDLYPRSPRNPAANRRYQSRGWLSTTIVKEGASLGAGAIIIAGTTIGQYALIAAGAIVTHDVPPHAHVRGNPARVCGWVCVCGLPLSFTADHKAQCECGLRFTLQDNNVCPEISMG